MSKGLKVVNTVQSPSMLNIHEEGHTKDGKDEHHLENLIFMIFILFKVLNKNSSFCCESLTSNDLKVQIPNICTDIPTLICNHVRTDFG